ncbi:fimbrial protein [Paraburkholderia solisilvae]|uniref:fimbrial protein n=1 Tax=Paraburkholderia solisilvae TaxID=624376 RepID=UPI0015824606|nr:fimbrial protein [Paraburkholderia solisilvae]
MINAPAVINVPANAPVGTLLTSLITVPATNFYTCTPVSGQSNVTGVAFEAAGLTKAGFTVSPGGTLPVLTVFNTSVPGIGIAIAVRPSNGNCGAGPYVDLGGTTATAAIPSPWVGSTCGSTGTATNGGQAQVVLVKTMAGAVAVGTISGVLFQAASVIQQSGKDVVQTGAGAPGLITFSISPVSDVPPSCTTPNVVVPMTTYSVSAFKGVGSTTPPVSFNLAINNCSAGLTSIVYQFSAPGGIANAAAGVIALTTDSTAKQIGLQVTDGNGVPLKYDGTTYSVTGVTSSPGSYVVPLKAAYFQIGSPIVAGNANANLVFSMTYQ